MPTVLELQQTANEHVTKARAIQTLIEKDKRSMTAEENTNFDKYMADYDAVKLQIEGVRKDEARSSKLKEAEDELKKSAGRKAPGDDPANAGERRTENPNVFEFRARNTRGMLGHLGTKKIDFSNAPKNLQKMATPEARAAFRDYLASGHKLDELRALQVDLDTAGGYLVTPQQFAAELIAVVDDEVFIRKAATVYTLTSATTLGVPSRDVDIADSDWTSELATGNLDTALAFGKRELHPHPLAKRIKVSNKLLRAGALDVESIVRDRLAYKFGITQEKAFQTGSGVQQPLGLFTPSADGIDTTRDVVVGANPNFTADGMISAKYALKVQYWKGAQWLLNRTSIALIRKLKDANGQYLWAPSGIGQANLSQDNADRILDFPFMMSEYTPNTYTSGAYVGMVGDFSHYWIADALNMQLQRLVELYAENNQTGYIARAEVDGMPVLAEPFVRLSMS